MYIQVLNLELDKYKHILVCPLDWGLGHATRCIPLINHFLEKSIKVSIGGNGRSLRLLRMEFPQLSFFELPDYGITYPKNGKLFILHVGAQTNKVLKAISKEKKQIKKLVKWTDIDMILSDNRFGCYDKRCHSVFMSHQINIALPQGLNWLNKVNQQFIAKYDELWIPDYQGEENLSGKLSHGPGIDAKYLGVLSRFENTGNDGSFEYDVLAIVSGPEPQKSIFENEIHKKLLSSGLSCALVRGVPGELEERKEGKLSIWNHLASAQLNALINKSRMVICRAGYSSIMDLYKLKKPAILVPTPGQTEQEYLAKHLNGKMGFTFLEQDELNEFDFSNKLGNVLSN